MKKNISSMKEGLLMGGALVVAGLLLQLIIGPVVWKAFAWPANAIVLAVFLAIIDAIFLLRKRVRVFRFIGTYQAAIPALAYAVVLTVVMGVTRQKTDGTWLNDMLTFWPFVLIYVYVAMILGVAILRRLAKLQLSSFKRDVPFLLNHFGLFLAMTTATLGNADMQRLKMITVVGEPEFRALTQEGAVREMPLTIELKQFIMETYDNGKPKRYASELLIRSKGGEEIHATVDVNKPVEVDGWKIYQHGYDTQMGANSQMSILELVSDPWLPLVYAGIYMMLGGALLLLTYTRWSYKRLLPVGILVVVALGIVSYFMPVIRSTKLVPALQSPWFVPHILVYIICYSLMGVAAVMAIWTLVSRKKSGGFQDSSKPPYAHLDNLVYVGLLFMTFGMMFGAFWAKEAWGHYWAWDPKETWAAITWFSYLVYIHYRQLTKQKPSLALLLLVISFVLLQMCWWGINYLPSAQGSSAHTYGT